MKQTTVLITGPLTGIGRANAFAFAKLSSNTSTQITITHKGHGGLMNRRCHDSKNFSPRRSVVARINGIGFNWHCGRLIFSTFAAVLLPWSSANATQFQLTLPSDHVGPVSGRLIVFASRLSNAASALPQSIDASSFEPLDGVIVAAQEVNSWAPGRTIALDADITAYPTAFKNAPPGRYAMQTVLDVNHSYARDGRGAGDLLSPVVAADFPAGGSLTLGRELPPADPWKFPPSASAQLAADAADARAHSFENLVCQARR